MALRSARLSLPQPPDQGLSREAPYTNERPRNHDQPSPLPKHETGACQPDAAA